MPQWEHVTYLGGEVIALLRIWGLGLGFRDIYIYIYILPQLEYLILGGGRVTIGGGDYLTFRTLLHT